MKIDIAESRPSRKSWHYDESTSSKFRQPDSTEDNPNQSFPQPENIHKTTDTETAKQECEPRATNFLHQGIDKKRPVETPGSDDH